MKKSKLDAVLQRKVRIKITKRKRGRFEVVLPAELFDDDGFRRRTFGRKREAMVYLLTRLRCMKPFTIEINGSPKKGERA
jgi:hypothetical protein